MVLLLYMTAELPACINRTAMIASTQKNIFGFITMGVVVIFAGHKYAIPRSLQSVGTLVMDYKKLIFLELTDMMLKKAPPFDWQDTTQSGCRDKSGDDVRVKILSSGEISVNYRTP